MASERSVVALLDNYYVRSQIQRLAESSNTMIDVYERSTDLMPAFIERRTGEVIVVLDVVARSFKALEIAEELRAIDPNLTIIGVAPAINAELVRNSKLGGIKHVLPYDKLEDLLLQVQSNFESNE